MSWLLKNVLLLLLLVFLSLGGFWYLTRTPEQGLDHISVGSGSATSSNPADEFASLLSSLKTVDFQKNADPKTRVIFDDPIFKFGLISFRRDLPEIDRSRPNPFAPLEGNPASYVHYGSAARNIFQVATTTLNTAPSVATSSKATTTKK
ncbi:MAG: hypothetical protein NTY66_00080 [Candidatus Vogelbacteria bacterium]|nr:hypothetical protein [Candidatus Vogelbacteria bacterium]